MGWIKDISKSVSKTDGDYKRELTERLNNDFFDFAHRNGKGWEWTDLSDFIIRRGWRHEEVNQ